MTELELKDAVLTFFRLAQDFSSQSSDAHYSYNALLPRLNFLKNLPRNSTLLDLGAGDGSLSTYREWPLNPRLDIRLLALSLSKGEMFNKYDGFELKNFETDPDIFSNERIDAVVCCHFIEHMTNPEPTIKFLANRLGSGGRIYLEWPHVLSKKMPQRQWLVDNGVNISTTRSDDDGTHIEAWDIGQIQSLIEANGFYVEATARIVLPDVADRMRDVSKKNNDVVGNTLAFWAKFGWSQYLIAERI